jgi:Tol biopolymer transport system component
MNSSNPETRAVQLTKDGRLKADPVFVRGGDELVFTVLETPTQWSLMRLKVAEGSVERLHPQATTSEFEPAFTPDGSLYCFVQNRANLNLKLVIRDTKQNKDSIYDPGGGFAGMRSPTIAPDASRIVFSLADATGQQIFAVDAQARNRVNLTKTSLNNWPAYSPDGKQIAFGSSRDGHFEIYLMDARGEGVRRLTTSNAFNIRPAWSPDGKRIAFTSNRDANYEIYVMDADGRNHRRITRNDERDDYASWHPDGKRLVMVCERAGRSDLFLVEVD